MTRLGYALGTTIAAQLFASLFVGVALLKPSPRFAWNASASAPLGLYRLTPTTHPAVGDLVTVTPPPALAALLDSRHYLPLGVPLLKHVAAMKGTRVCRHGETITIGGHKVAVAKLQDSQHRSLPVWRGCHVLGAHEIFLLNAAPDSLDGRYFGSLPLASVTARAIPILTRDAPGQALHWRGLADRPACTPASKGPRSC